MVVTSRIKIVFSIYKKGDEKDVENDRPISLLNWDCKIYTTTLTKQM